MVLSKKSSRFNIWLGKFSFVDLSGADPVHSFFPALLNPQTDLSFKGLGLPWEIGDYTLCLGF